MLTWVAALGIVLQGLWAGAAAVVAFRRLRSRRDLVVGGAALVVLLALEAFIGGEVYDNPGLTALHIPLALALVGLAAWLPFRARTP